MQLMRVVGQGSVNNLLKLQATMLLKQPKMLEQFIPVFGLPKVPRRQTLLRIIAQFLRD